MESSHAHHIHHAKKHREPHHKHHLINLLVRRRLAKSIRQARIILMGFSLFCFATSTVIFISAENSRPEKLQYKFSKETLNRLPLSMQVNILQ